ncbi:MAG: hypothetical protein WBF54_00330, partial [Terriglobales bacterium]
SAAKEFAEKVEFRCPTPKGASDFKRLAVSLKRYPDTKLSFSALCKAALNTVRYRSAEALRHPKSSARSTFSAAS